MSLKQEIYNNIRKFLIANTKRNIFVNMNITERNMNNNTISFGNSFFNDYDQYITAFLGVANNNDYLVSLSDGSLLQYSLTTTGKKKKEIITKIRIAYLPLVQDGKWKNDYIRFDYENNNGSFFHNRAHLHIGLDSEMRIPVDVLFDFEQFCSLIFYFYYQEHFNKLYNNSKNIKIKYATNELICDKLSHFIFLTGKNFHLQNLIEK